MTLLQAAADTADKASGTAPLAIALVGLAGVLVGTVISVLGTIIESTRSERRAQRQELRDHYSKFVAAIDERHLLNLEVERARKEVNRESVLPDPDKFRKRSKKRAAAARHVVAASTRKIEQGNALIELISQQQVMVNRITALSSYFLILGDNDLWAIARTLASNNYPEHKRRLEAILGVAVANAVAPRWRDRRPTRRRLIRKVDPEFWNAYVDPGEGPGEMMEESPKGDG